MQINYYCIPFSTLLHFIFYDTRWAKYHLTWMAALHLKSTGTIRWKQHTRSTLKPFLSETTLGAMACHSDGAFLRCGTSYDVYVLLVYIVGLLTWLSFFGLNDRICVHWARENVNIYCWGEFVFEIGLIFVLRAIITSIFKWTDQNDHT